MRMAATASGLRGFELGATGMFGRLNGVDLADGCGGDADDPSGVMPNKLEKKLPTAATRWALDSSVVTGRRPT